MKYSIGILLTLISFTSLFSQDEVRKREKGFQFNVQGIAMAVGDTDESLLIPEELVMHISNSRLFGINAEFSYRFDEFLIVGLGTGYEYITQPSISYIPVYLSLKSSIGKDTLSEPVFRLDIGTHLGDLAKSGALLRVGMGYRVPVYKKLCLVIEGLITYQGVRKKFDIAPDVIQYYNFLGGGISVGIEI